MTETTLARAKINLCLHVTGQRADGYHLLDSLVAFAEVGDLITCAQAPALGLTITGPQGAGLSAGEDNLVLRAARALGDMGAAITLEKHLPVSSGIGGGSADAAATLQALARLWGQPLPDPSTVLALGADVPVCLHGQPCRMQGVGEVITPLPHPLPRAHLVLANPGVAVSTPAIFRALARKDNPPMPANLPRYDSAQGLADLLHQQRNDLEAPAMALAPVIADTKAALAAQPGCLLARMSGSGATCFGLFADARAAEAAAATLSADYPVWWVKSAALG